MAYDQHYQSGLAGSGDYMRRIQEAAVRQVTQQTTTPSPDAELRKLALTQALTVASGHGWPADSVIAAARAFEAYLREG